jgi:hypothetical protein
MPTSVQSGITQVLSRIKQSKTRPTLELHQQGVIEDEVLLRSPSPSLHDEPISDQKLLDQKLFDKYMQKVHDIGTHIRNFIKKEKEEDQLSRQVTKDEVRELESSLQKELNERFRAKRPDAKDMRISRGLRMRTPEEARKEKRHQRKQSHREVNELSLLFKNTGTGSSSTDKP